MDNSIVCEDAWYLPFFVIKTEKPRVVYDHAEKVDDKSLNQAVLAVENLLNHLLQVLLRFFEQVYVCC